MRYRLTYKHVPCGAIMVTHSYEPAPPSQYYLHECKVCDKWFPAAEFVVLECEKRDAYNKLHSA